MRQICETLDFNKSTLYYQPKSDPSEEVLREEIEQLAARYPTYGYRRITKVLLRLGYRVGYRRVARLMKAANLSVSVKRICQTTMSLQGERPYVNRLQSVSVSRCDQVWVGDITYVRLKGHFVYVSLLMDVFTRMIRAWHLSQHLTQSLTLKPLQQALRQYQRFITAIKACSIFQMLISQCSGIMTLRFPSHGEGVLGRTGTPKG